MADKLYLSKQEAADHLGVKIWTIERLCDDREIESFKVRGTVKITRASIDGYVDRQLSDSRLRHEQRSPSVAASRLRRPLPILDQIEARRAARTAAVHA